MGFLSSLYPSFSSRGLLCFVSLRRSFFTCFYWLLYTLWAHLFSYSLSQPCFIFPSTVYLLVLNLRPSRLAASAQPREVAMLKVSLFFSPGRPCLTPVPLLSTAARTVPDANEPKSKEEHKAENSREVTTKDLITFRCMTIIIYQKYIKLKENSNHCFHKVMQK